MRNQHRIWDAKKHLLLTLDRLKKKFVEKYMINMKIQQYVLNSLKHIFNRGKFEQSLAVQQKVSSLDVRNQHRIWDAKKHLLLTLDRLKKKFVEKYIINMKIQQYFLNSLKHLLHAGNTRAETCSPSKGLFSRCEKSSQNLGCSKTSTADT